MNPTLRGSLYTAVFFFASEILYKLYKRFKKNKNELQESESESRLLSSTSLQVLFFPDKEVACRQYFTSGDGCHKLNCLFSHGETSLGKLFRKMASCKKTMDVSVFVITCKDLAEILLLLHKRGVRIRIITDNEQLNSSGSQVWSLRKEGIPVRTNNSTYLMHHKFVVIDGKILINGSFNWTHQAITGNQENVIITDDEAVTSLFISEFQKLWGQFAPDGQKL